MLSLLLEQYSDSKNFVARIDINMKFRTNPQTWTSWMFGQMQFEIDQIFLSLDVEMEFYGKLIKTRSV